VLDVLGYLGRDLRGHEDRDNDLAEVAEEVCHRRCFTLGIQCRLIEMVSFGNQR
jgi:hypothetical protein